MLITLFGSVVGTRVHVFFVEFGMLAGAAIAAAIGLAAVSIDPAALSRWPLIGAAPTTAISPAAQTLSGLRCPTSSEGRSAATL